MKLRTDAPALGTLATGPRRAYLRAGGGGVQRPGVRLLLVMAAVAACSRGNRSPTEPAASDGGTVVADPGTAADAGTAMPPSSPCPTDPARTPPPDARAVGGCDAASRGSLDGHEERRSDP